MKHKHSDERKILIEALRDEYPRPTRKQVDQLDADITKLVKILVDYFIEELEEDFRSGRANSILTSAVRAIPFNDNDVRF
jgi:hypothetical protein